jgi:hypothetical protein
VLGFCSSPCDAKHAAGARGEGWSWGAVGTFALAPLLIALKHAPDRVPHRLRRDELGDITGPSAATAAPDGLGGSEVGLGVAGGRPALETVR